MHAVKDKQMEFFSPEITGLDKFMKVSCFAGC